MSTTEPMVMQLSFGNGTGTRTISVGDRLASHFTQGTGRWRYLFVDIPGTAGFQVIGTLVISKGGRIIFFPMYEIRATPPGMTSTEVVDHITLDPRRSNGKRTSHIAFVNTRGRQRGHRGINHQVGSDGTGNDYWFSLRIPIRITHTDLPSTLVMPFDVDKRGLVNRINSMAGEMIESQFLPLAPLSSIPKVETLQFDFWTSPNKPTGTTSPMGFRFGSSQPASTTIRPSVQAEFDFGQQQVWFRVLTSLRDDPASDVQLFRSRLNDGIAELLT